MADLLLPRRWIGHSVYEYFNSSVFRDGPLPLDWFVDIIVMSVFTQELWKTHPFTDPAHRQRRVCFEILLVRTEMAYTEFVDGKLSSKNFYDTAWPILGIANAASRGLGFGLIGPATNGDSLARVIRRVRARRGRLLQELSSSQEIGRAHV